ncbi:MAG: hypothetical protein SGPRY_004974 [Prymnesium sp.]
MALAPVGVFSAFVGNLAPQVSDMELARLFGQAGCRVTAARLAVNRETGKPKPFGFVDFADQESLDAAVTRFDGFTLHGRPMKVDPSSSRAAAAAPPGKRRRDDRNLTQMPAHVNSAFFGMGQGMMTGAVGRSVGCGIAGGFYMVQALDRHALAAHAPHQAPVVANPQLASSEHINNLSDQQLWDLISQIKVAVEEDASQARRKLVENPTLGLALLKAQIRLKMVTKQSIMSVMARHEDQNARPNPQAAGMEIHHHIPKEEISGAECHLPLNTVQPGQQQQMLHPSIAPEMQAMLHQVMAMTPEQINALPQAQRAQIELLRQQMANSTLAPVT